MPETKRMFVDCPLGTRFKYPGQERVYVILERWGCGLIAEWSGVDGPTVTQGVYSFAESTDELLTSEIIVEENQ